MKGSTARTVESYDTSRLATKFACEIHGFDPLEFMERKLVGRTARFTQIAVAAAQMAIEDASLDVSAHCAPNLHAHVGAAVPNLRHIEYFHDHQRIERMFFDGALDPAGGMLHPDPARPGLGMELRTADAGRFRRA